LGINFDSSLDNLPNSLLIIRLYRKYKGFLKCIQPNTKIEYLNNIKIILYLIYIIKIDKNI